MNYATKALGIAALGLAIGCSKGGRTPQPQPLLPNPDDTLITQGGLAIGVESGEALIGFSDYRLLSSTDKLAGRIPPPGFDILYQSASSNDLELESKVGGTYMQWEDGGARNIGLLTRVAVQMPGMGMPWLGQTDTGLMLGDTLADFLAEYPTAQPRTLEAGLADNGDHWTAGPLHVRFNYDSSTGDDRLTAAEITFFDWDRAPMKKVEYIGPEEWH